MGAPSSSPYRQRRILRALRAKTNRPELDSAQAYNLPLVAETNVLPKEKVALPAKHNVRRLVLLRRTWSVKRYVGSSRASFHEFIGDQVFL
jgi:hypothetical protein